MKKRNCRRDNEERAIHDQAIRLRKMTDAQLCDFVSQTYQDGVAAGQKLAAVPTPQTEGGAASVSTFLAFLEERVGTGNRIGKGTIIYLHRELEAAIATGIFAAETA